MAPISLESFFGSFFFALVGGTFSTFRSSSAVRYSERSLSCVSRQRRKSTLRRSFELGKGKFSPVHLGWVLSDCLLFCFVCFFASAGQLERVSRPLLPLLLISAVAMSLMMCLTAAVVLAVMYGSVAGGPAAPSRLDGFSLEEVISGRFYGEVFNGTWISGSPTGRVVVVVFCIEIHRYLSSISSTLEIDVMKLESFYQYNVVVEQFLQSR